MRRVGIALAIVTSTVTLVGCGGNAAPDYTSYGEPMKISDREAIPVATVIESPERYTDKTILVSGIVSEVCAHKGCWIRLAEKVGGKSVFVKFVCPVEGRLIPLDSVGQETLVEGTLVVETLSQDEARHYAEDAGKSAEEVAKIVGPQTHLRMKSPAARVAQKAATARPEKS